MTHDLHQLNEFGQDRLPPVGEPPAALRTRVLAATDATPAPARRRGVRLLPASRPAWRLGALGAVAAAAAVALLAVPALNNAGNAPPAGVAADAPAILRLAAQHAAAQPATTSGRYLLVEARTTNLDIGAGAGGEGVSFNERKAVEERFISVDGSRASVARIRSADRPGDAGTLHEFIVGGYCTPASDEGGCARFPGILTGLPTDADAMLRHLYAPRPEDPKDGPVPLSKDELAFWHATRVINASPQAPRVLATAFEATARIPGVTRIGQVTDVAGREGVAVARTFGNTRLELVFDPKSYALLGTNTVALGPWLTPTGADGGSIEVDYPSFPQLVAGEAIMKAEFVDEAPALPRR